jgi:hypothetical protein
MTAPRIALIHAVTVAVDPIKSAFGELWPQASTINILDDSLSPDRARDPDLTAVMSARIGALGDYALSNGCHGVLYTCSAFGEAIDAFAKRAPVPVLKPNEAMFEAALGIGDCVGMLATFGPSVASMEAEFHEQAHARGRKASPRDRFHLLRCRPSASSTRCGRRSEAPAGRGCSPRRPGAGTWLQSGASNRRRPRASPQ